MIISNLLRKTINLGPIIFLYYLSISEIDTHFENQFEILSFNIQLIIIYFWTLKRPNILGNGHIFFAGLINDVVTGVPLGLSFTFILNCFFYCNLCKKNMTVNTTIASDWFTFFIAIVTSNFLFTILLSNFSNITVSMVEISYDTFFTLIFFFHFFGSFLHIIIQS